MVRLNQSKPLLLGVKLLAWFLVNQSISTHSQCWSNKYGHFAVITVKRAASVRKIHSFFPLTRLLLKRDKSAKRKENIEGCCNCRREMWVSNLIGSSSCMIILIKSRKCRCYTETTKFGIWLLCELRLMNYS